MLQRRESSRARFVEYFRKRKTDATYVSRGGGADDRAGKPDKWKRGRGFFDLFAAFWRLTRGGSGSNHRPYTYLALCTLTITTCIGLTIPASTKVALDYVLSDHPGPAGLPGGLRDWALAMPREHLLWWLGGAMIATALLAVAIG